MRYKNLDIDVNNIHDEEENKKAQTSHEVEELKKMF